MSLNPRKTPCMAKERRTAGAPSDLSVKYCCAGVIISESYIHVMQLKSQESLKALI